MTRRFPPPPRAIENIELQRWVDLLYYTMPRAFEAKIDPASVPANTTDEQNFTVKGLQTTDFVTVSKPTHEPGLGIVNARVVTTDTLGITFANLTASPINPAPATYNIIALRK